MVDQTAGQPEIPPQALHEQTALSNLITSISTRFVSLEREAVDAGILEVLSQLGEFFEVDRTYVFLFVDEGRRISQTHEWRAPGVAAQSESLQHRSTAVIPWLTRQIRNRRIVRVERLSDLPRTAKVDKSFYEELGVRSLLLVPMIFQGRVLGFLGFDSMQEERRWDRDTINLLKIAGEIFTSAIERKRIQDALQEGQQLLEQRIEERTLQLSSLLDLSQGLAVSMELGPQLDLILEQLKLVVDYNGASILRLQNNVLTLVAYRGPIPHEVALTYSFPLEHSGANKRVIETRETLIIPDVRGNTPLAKQFQATAGEDLDTTFSYLRCWMGVPLVVRDQVIGMLTLDHPTPGFYQPSPHAIMARAYANQVAASLENARLYNEVRQRAEEARTLFSVQQAITSRLEPDTVLQMIADAARRLTQTQKGAVYILKGDWLEVAVVSGDVQKEMLGYRLPVDGSVAGLAVNSGKSFVIEDAEQDQRAHAEIIQQVGAQAFVIVPLMSSTGPIGTITVANKDEGSLGSEDERVLSMLASGAVIALENAHLYHEELERRREVDRRRQVAEGLRDIIAILNSNRPLQESLEEIIHHAMRLLDASAGSVYQYDPVLHTMHMEAGYNLPADLALQVAGDGIPVYEGGAIDAMLEKKPYLIEDLQSYLQQSDPEKVRKNKEGARWLAALAEHYQAVINVPLTILDEIYGSLALYFDQPQEIAEEDVALALSFADQAALAIENARLRMQAERSAVAAERSRLARDLHDAVTQALFSASLIAEVLPRLWERNREEGERRLEELRQLTRGALAEMRTLLVELRPAALVDAELNELFRHLTDAFTTRMSIPVQLRIEGTHPLPAEVKVALYRIAQEALNNVAKHAHASQVELLIQCDEEGVQLSVWDDGSGFDPSQVSPESLGLGIMWERAEGIGADLSINSHPGGGTEISVVWKENTI